MSYRGGEQINNVWEENISGFPILFGETLIYLMYSILLSHKDGTQAREEKLMINLFIIFVVVIVIFYRKVKTIDVNSTKTGPLSFGFCLFIFIPLVSS